MRKIILPDSTKPFWMQRNISKGPTGVRSSASLNEAALTTVMPVSAFLTRSKFPAGTIQVRTVIITMMPNRITIALGILNFFIWIMLFTPSIFRDKFR